MAVSSFLTAGFLLSVILLVRGSACLNQHTSNPPIQTVEEDQDSALSKLNLTTPKLSEPSTVGALSPGFSLSPILGCSPHVQTPLP